MTGEANIVLAYRCVCGVWFVQVNAENDAEGVPGLSHDWPQNYKFLFIVHWTINRLYL